MLNDAQLKKRDAKRKIGQELLEAMKEVGAGRARPRSRHCPMAAYGAKSSRLTVRWNARTCW